MMTKTLYNSDALPAKAARKVKVAPHHRHPLRMDGTQIGVFEQFDQVSLSCFLNGHTPLSAQCIALRFSRPVYSPQGE